MLSRRAFFLSAIATSAAPTLVRAQDASRAAADMNGAPTILRLERRNLEVNGKPASVFGITQPDGTQGIVTQVGARFRVRVDNKIEVPSLIHWHGLTPPTGSAGWRSRRIRAADSRRRERGL